jgi:ABC-2 type transport system permease protein
MRVRLSAAPARVRLRLGTGWRGYAKTAAMAATSYAGDSPLFLLDYLLRFLRVMVLLALWRTILAGKGVVSGMGTGSVLTYTLVGEAFAGQFAVRSGLDAALWDGTITNRFLRPVGIFRELIAELCGRWCFGLVTFSLPLLLAAPLLGVEPRPAGAPAAALFIASLGLAISVGLALDFVFGTLMVALDVDRWSLEYLRSAVTLLLTGALVPLALLPWGMGSVLSWLPFASMASAPLRIYTGTGDPWSLLALQAGWSLLLWPLARWFWLHSRERVVSYGG